MKVASGGPSPFFILGGYISLLVTSGCQNSMGQQPMDTSDLLGKIANLESSLDRFEFWLTFATALVILGLILVCGFEIREAIATLKKEWSWKPLGVIAGGILITVGVAGELALQFFASSQQTALRKANDAVA